MRIYYGILAAFSLLFTGCGLELLTTTAIQGDLQAEQLKAMKGQINRTSDTTAKINIQKSIDTYMAEKGSYPATLDALVPDFLPSLPHKPDGTPYGYDSASGKVLDDAAMNGGGAMGQSTPVASAPSQADFQKLQQIQSAVARYAREKGAYPASLQALVPSYVLFLPKTDGGQDYTYSSQTGAVAHPAQGFQQPAAVAVAPTGRSMGTVGGSGPMGEAMTGIAVQNQLNSMNNSGVSSAGGYARRGISSATQQHNQQQEKAVKDLGM